VINISELHDKLISDATKALIVGQQMDKIGKMISATIEARIQNEFEQEYKDLGKRIGGIIIYKYINIFNY
jgi:hypothetical protein